MPAGVSKPDNEKMEIHNVRYPTLRDRNRRFDRYRI
jgi:hypothetical protein